MTDAPRISATEAMAFLVEWTHAKERRDGCRDMGVGAVKEALAAFLAARVPEPHMGYGHEAVGFNACREAVLKGGKE